MVFFGPETYIHFVAPETRIIRKLFIFFTKNVQIYKFHYLLELIVIINDYQSLIPDFDLF